MTVQNWTTNVDQLGDGSWVGDAYGALLLKGSGYTFDPDDVFVSDLTPGSNEVSASGYARVDPITTPTRTIELSAGTPPNVIVLSCDPLPFGTITAGQTVTGMVVFKSNGSDATNQLISLFSIASIDSGDLSPFTIPIPTNGLWLEF